MCGLTLSVEEAAPEPTEFTARIATVYEVPFARPLIAIGERVDAGLRVTHVEPPSTEYS